MFDAVTTRELRQLAEQTSSHQVSIFLPTHAAGPSKAQDPILLGRLVGDARNKLVDLGMRGPDADDFLAPATALVDDAAFWRTTSDGLAVFVDADGLRRFRVDTIPTARCVVADRFQLRPLLPAVALGDSFWILALSRRDVRLLQGNRVTGMERVDLGDVPTDISSALRFDDRERQLQSHASSRVGSGGVGITMHGQGGVKDTSDDERTRYCRVIDAGVRQAIGDSADPLVLAGERRLLDDFTSVSRLGSILDREVVGNPDRLTDQELSEAAWDVVREDHEQRMEETIAAFGAAVAHRTSSLDETILAAVDGKVRSLIVPLDLPHHGVLRRDERIVEDRPVGQPGVGDLFDLAVAETLRHGGQAHAVDQASVPGPGPVAATLRF